MVTVLLVRELRIYWMNKKANAMKGIIIAGGVGMCLYCSDIVNL